MLKQYRTEGVIEAGCDEAGRGCLAGDVYAAGFLYGYANNLPLTRCAEIGTSCAAQVIQEIGAKITPERWDKIHDKLKVEK
jgi:fructose-1-phosphate kinase PfkB-like protein